MQFYIINIKIYYKLKIIKVISTIETKFLKLYNLVTERVEES
jgi:hypothetical protein